MMILIAVTIKKMIQKYFDKNINIIDSVFYICVNFLIYWAEKFNITYNQINVIIFCIIWPIITLISLCTNIYLLL